MPTNITGALAYIAAIKVTHTRAYAERVFAYYRDYGTPRQTAGPRAENHGVSPKANTRIWNAMRHFMVGDCNINGVLL